MVHTDLIASTGPNVVAAVAPTDMDVKAAVLGMWKDAGVRRAAAKSHEYTQNGNLSFYFENVKRMFDLVWIPTDRDMLHTRLKRLALLKLCFRTFDVGIST
jgi:guanine nucleotide-binding protein subunit alpha